MVDCKNPAFSLYKVLKVMQDFSINSIDPYMGVYENWGGYL